MLLRKPEILVADFIHPVIAKVMVGWHHLLNGHEFEQAPGAHRQGSLECCSPWGHKESDMTEQLN